MDILFGKILSITDKYGYVRSGENTYYINGKYFDEKTWKSLHSNTELIFKSSTNSKGNNYVSEILNFHNSGREQGKLKLIRKNSKGMSWGVISVNNIDYYFNEKCLSNNCKLELLENNENISLVFTTGIGLNNKNEIIWKATDVCQLVENKEDLTTYSNVQVVSSDNKSEILKNEKNKEDENPISLAELVNNHQKFYKDWVSRLITSIKTVPEYMDWSDFEDLTFTILKLIGIQEIYQIPRKKQAGQEDGFFTFSRLAVIYDCTLKYDFETSKNQQIENYVRKINKENKVHLNVKRNNGSIKKDISIDSLTKQVWIITRGETRELYEVDDVLIKEISLNSLIRILEKRLKDFDYNEDKLCSDLIFLD